MQKLNKKKILGTVPKKLQLVETFWDCPEFSRNKQKGITLIALIITIIVMLILVGVTINVALNGGLFSKGEEATKKTKIAQIQEALTLKRAEVLADYKGKAPADYGIELNDLNLPAELKTEYENKLIISADGKLYYDASVVTNAEEQDQFKSMGIEEYIETNTGTLANSYTFTMEDMAKKEGAKVQIGSDGVTITVPFSNFWPQGTSEELKIGTSVGEGGQARDLYNVVSNNGLEYNSTLEGKNGTFMFMKMGDEICLGVSKEAMTEEEFKNYSFTIEKYVGTNTTQLYSFTLNEMNESGAFERYSDGTLYYNKEVFWQTVGTDLSGQYGIDMSNGTTIKEMSTDSTELSFYTGVYSEGKFEILFGEQNNSPIIMIAYYNSGDAQIDYFDRNGGYSEILNRFGDVTIYFGVK